MSLIYDDHQQHAHLQQQHNGHGRAKTLGGSKLRAASNSRSRDKERKWRVLLSIGLLLPALAAIIGIVAWAISVEVANGSSSGGEMADGANRKQHQAPVMSPQASAFQLLRRHQQLQRAEGDATSGERRQLLPAGGKLSDARGSSPVAAAVVSGGGSQQQPAARHPKREKKSSSGSQQRSRRPATAEELAPKRSGQQELNREQDEEEAEKEESGSERSRKASDRSLLLTSLGQVEALSGSADAAATTTTTTTTTTEPLTTGGFGEDEEEKEGEIKELDGSGSRSRGPSDTGAIGGGESEEEDEQQEGGSGKAGKGRDEQVNERRAEEEAAANSLALAKNLGHKSRWLNGNLPQVASSSSAKQTNKKPQQQQAADARRASIAGQKQQQPDDNSGNTDEQQETSGPRANHNKHSSSYRVVYAENQEEDSAEKLQQNPAKRKPQSKKSGKRPAVADADQEPVSVSTKRYVVLGRGDEEARLSSSRVLNTEDTSAKSTGSGDEPEGEKQEEPKNSRPNQDKRHRYIQLQQQQQQQQRDDELSFEAIASAISTTLSATNQEQPAQTDGAASEEAGNSNGNRWPEPASSRRRSPGEHVADVIDHIVERRKQQRELLSLDHNGADQAAGPQIVVVAPVAGTGSELMRARSLTKAAPTSGEGQWKSQATGVQEDKRIVQQSSAKSLAASKKNALSQLNERKSQGRRRIRPTKPLGARLLGSSPAEVPAGDKNSAAANAKFSERVEVIEDDDSSAFLFKESVPAGSSQQEAADDLQSIGRRDEYTSGSGNRRVDQSGGQDKNAEDELTLEQLVQESQLTSHVSSQPGEARLRSPRNGSPIGLAFERYARPQQPEVAASRQQQQAPSGARLYSAEELIMEHVLKSRLTNRPEGDQSEIKRAGGHMHQQVKQQAQPLPATHQVKVAPTTIRPVAAAQSSSTPAATSAPSAETSGQRDSRQQQPSIEYQSVVESSGNRQAAGVQSVQVPLFLARGPKQAAAMQQQVPFIMQQAATRPQVELYKPMESQQSVNYQLPPTGGQSQVSHQSMDHQHHQQQQPAEGQQQQAASSLPVFADQEYNVPAHMAESVIQNIQRSPSTLGLINGRPTIVNGGGSSTLGQVPSYRHQLSQANSQSPASTYPQQGSSYPMMMSSSQAQPFYHHPVSQQQQQQRLANWNQMLAARHLHNQQQQRQVIANREGSGSGSSEPTPISISLKPPRGLVHPVAQMALKHLISSFGGSSSSSSEKATGDEPKDRGQLKAAAAALPEDDPAQSRAMESMMMQAQASAPSPSAVQLPAAGGSGPELGARSSRHLMPPPNGQQQPQQLISDQDVQESYGQVPTYHMGPPPPPQYQADGGYQSEHDKKSKGITFHFGGGPIGGGTQLITSPMGIFKHLMIPLLPNPRVNLNGKVVFGVVLEKSTAFGEPKKKYKFWGR